MVRLILCATCMLVHVGSPESFPHNRKMTVAELKAELSKMGDDSNVAIVFCGEKGDEILKINGILLLTGSPSRSLRPQRREQLPDFPKGTPRFTFTLQDEGAPWVFIEASPA